MPRFIICSLIVLSLCTTAMADLGTIKLDYQGRVDGHSYPSGGVFKWGEYSAASDNSDIGGESLFDKAVQPSYNDPNTKSLYTFCIEVDQGIRDPSHFKIKSLQDSGVGDDFGSPYAAEAKVWLERLGDMFFEDALNGTIDDSFFEPAQIGSSSEQAGVFQLAVWNIAENFNDIYDDYIGGSDNAPGVLDKYSNPDSVIGLGGISAGYLQQAARGLLQAVADDIGIGDYDDPNVTLLALTNKKRQDQIVQIHTPQQVPTPVPELSSVAVWSVLSGLMGVAVYRRRRYKA